VAHRRRGGSVMSRGDSKEERWLQEERQLNGSPSDCKTVVPASNPAPPQRTANSFSP
jgi:hypothetical protein